MGVPALPSPVPLDFTELCMSGGVVSEHPDGVCVFSPGTCSSAFTVKIWQPLGTNV